MTVMCSNDNNVKSDSGDPEKKNSDLRTPPVTLDPNENQSSVVHIVLANNAILYMRNRIQC